jgi:hypothetical protein
MNWLNLIRHQKQLPQHLEKPLRIIIKTNQQGKIEVLDAETGAVYTNVRVLYITVTSSGRVAAEVTINNVMVDLETDIK